MALWAMSWDRAVRRSAAALFFVGASVLGCGKSEPPQQANNESPPAAAPSGKGDGKAKEEKQSAKANEPPEDEFHHPFLKAARQIDNPPFDCLLPPSGMTISGKSVYRICKEVASQWDGIRFTTADGKRIHYSATVITGMGEIEIDLRPDLAPNHVRSFVALARAGYYDQLFFDRVNREEFPDQPGVRNDLLEAGCPLGTGDLSYGSVGYWLYPETQPSEKATHVEGTVGTCHGIEKDSGACKFYITLCKTPFNDTHYTIFGQVTRGLDVARKIFDQPVIADDVGHYGLLMPERPVMIQKVIIHTSEEK
jgi:cyclophilin family peptidyl-prolyl cis-trans isomerase